MDAVATEQREKKKCSYCGFEVAEGHATCPKCGWKVKGDKKSEGVLHRLGVSFLRVAGPILLIGVLNIISPILPISGVILILVGVVVGAIGGSLFMLVKIARLLRRSE